MPHTTGQISVFSLDGSSVLTTFDNVTAAFENTVADTSSVLAKGQRQSIMKTMATFTVPLRSVSGTTSDAATHLDLTSLAIGGTTLTCFTSTTLNISYAKANVPCAGSRYKMEDNTKLILDAEIVVQVVDTLAATIMSVFNNGAALSASNVTYSLVYNGVTYTIPMLMQAVDLVAEREGMQELRIKLQGRSPDTGNYPSAPTGTTGLLQKALNAFNTAIAISFQSITGTNGVAISGNVKFDSASFTIEDEQIVPVNYVFRSYGAMTVAAGT